MRVKFYGGYSVWNRTKILINLKKNVGKDRNNKKQCFLTSRGNFNKLKKKVNKGKFIECVWTK